MTEHTPIGLGHEAAPVRALTHSGNFHADETLGYVILHYALAPRGDLRARVLGAQPDDRLTFVRSRVPGQIQAADIVFDVGGVYDPAAGRYDHHMKNKPLREDGTPYSAAGLLWKDYGLAAIRNILDEPVEEAMEAAIWQAVDKALIIPVDQDDNGVAKMGRLSLAEIVSTCGAPWDTAERYGVEEAGRREMSAFADAAAIVGRYLVGVVDRARASLKATDRVLGAYEQADDKRILVLETGMPAEKVIFERELPVVYVVSPAGGGQWNVKAVPPARGEFGQRVPLPEAWGGLEGRALAEVSGIADTVFAHPARFICGAASREGALAMARRALEIAAA
ncbi:MYG1 family protein [Gluconacetobacter asukensis]|uniref:MYG1 family protein n=1 Tax=Gluconacetobacter asukensis TaxID=1017181 RepID=A0A7W4P2X1_9PROT|nr:MYG1 family protein [Gluconacetobacter asukensis]MBB2172185.1 MYG1 family protein [Gluconacetobacter asukensis]